MGRQFCVSTSTVDVFSTLAKGNGLCLSALFDQNKKPTESTARTREKIGQGITFASTIATTTLTANNNVDLNNSLTCLNETTQ